MVWRGLGQFLVLALLLQCSAGFKYEIANILMVRLWPEQDAALENFGRLCEWLEYSIAIGVEHFYIYDDANSDGEAFGDNPVLKTYIEDGYVTYHRLQEHGRAQRWSNWRQDNTYAQALRDYRGEVRWLLWMDMDEFVRLERDKSLQEFLDRQLPGGLRDENPPVTQFLFRCWFVSGALANPDNADLRLIEQYLWRENDAWEASKGRTKMLTLASEIKGFVNVHKAIMRTGADQEVSLDDAFLLHYWKLRSDKVASSEVHFYPIFAEQWGDFIFRKLVQRTTRAGVPLQHVAAGPFPALVQQKTFDPESAPDVGGNQTKTTGSRKQQLEALHKSISRLRSLRE